MRYIQGFKSIISLKHKFRIQKHIYLFIHLGGRLYNK